MNDWNMGLFKLESEIFLKILSLLKTPRINFLTIDFTVVKFRTIRGTFSKTLASMIDRSTYFNREYQDESESLG